MSTRIHCQDDENPIPVIESTMDHTDAHPFCPVDPSCPCHEDLALLTPLAQAVQDGLMTPDEATDYAMGRTLQGGGMGMNTPQHQQHHPSSRLRPRSCPRGEHTWTRTFRPSEALCLSCGMVTYCPACFLEQHLAPATRSYPLECQHHHGYVYHTAQLPRNEAHPS